MSSHLTHSLPPFSSTDCSLQRPVDFLDGGQGGEVPAGFDAAEGLHADARQLGELFLAQPGFNPIADDPSGDGGAAELDGRIVPFTVRLGQRRQVDCLGECCQPFVLGLLENNIRLSVETQHLSSHRSFLIKSILILDFHVILFMFSESRAPAQLSPHPNPLPEGERTIFLQFYRNWYFLRKIHSAVSAPTNSAQKS